MMFVFLSLLVSMLFAQKSQNDKPINHLRKLDEKIRETIEENYVQIGDRFVYRESVIPSYKICKNCVYFVKKNPSNVDGRFLRYPETHPKQESEFCGELFLKNTWEE